MSTIAVERAPLAVSVAFDSDEMTVVLVDGRRLSVPLQWFPRLAAATPVEREACELIGDGEGIHWPNLDEDISVEGLLR